MNNIELILFDLDGVLIDSNKAHLLSFQKMFEFENFFGYTSTLDAELGSITTKNKILEIEKRFNLKFHNKKQMFENKLKFLDFSLITPGPEILSIFNYLTNINIPFGIVSNARSFYVNKCLTEIIGFHLTEKLITTPDKNKLKPKPHSDMYQYAMNCYNVEPNKTLIFEDSEIGLRAAIGSNAHVRQILNINMLTKKLIEGILNSL